MKECVINGKKYTVQYIFNMVGNYEFVDEEDVYHLVDAEDVSIWLDDEQVIDPKGLAREEIAIEYAKYLAEALEDGVFWWKRYKIERDFIWGARRVEV